MISDENEWFLRISRGFGHQARMIGFVLSMRVISGSSALGIIESGISPLVVGLLTLRPLVFLGILYRRLALVDYWLGG